MKNKKAHILILEVLLMSKNNKQNKKQQTQADEAKKTGYGDKKLVGENRPAE